jgi:very-short-patch-repair endonuclease
MAGVLVVSGTRDQRIAEIASRQRGRLSRRQLLEAGLSSQAIRGAVARGQLIRLYGGVYAAGHLAEIEWAAETAALLTARRGAALSHRAAGELWGLTPRRRADAIDLTSAGNSSSSRTGIQMHRSRLLTSADLRVHKGLPVVSPAWALMDLAELLPDRRFELAFDRALVDRLVRPREIEQLLHRTHSRPGRPALKQLLQREHGATTLTRSEAEERFLALVRQSQLPEPAVNARVHGYEIDFYWPAQGLAVEIDGFRFHSTRRAVDHDHLKDADLGAAQISTIRFSAGQLVRQPLAVVARTARALASA